MSLNFQKRTSISICITYIEYVALGVPLAKTSSANLPESCLRSSRHLKAHLSEVFAAEPSSMLSHLSPSKIASLSESKP